MRAQGGSVPVSLLELQTISGQRYYFAENAIIAPSILSAFDWYHGGSLAPHSIVTGGPVPPMSTLAAEYTNVTFQDWLAVAPKFPETASLITSSSDCSVQNLSGNTVQRDGTRIFARQQLWGALFVYRLYNAAAEFALTTHIGNVSDIPSVGDTLDLTLRSWFNFSEIKAPEVSIDNNSCGNVFGSKQCGSTASFPCQNSYGSCTSLSRFKGIVTEWNNSAITQPIAIAQQAPNVDLNLRRYM